MQWPELVVMLAVAAAAWVQADERHAHFVRPAAWAAFVLVVVDLVYRGPGLQLAPLVLAAILLALAAGLRQRSPVRRVTGLAALGLVSTTVGLLLVLPFFALPEPTGPFSVGTRTLSLADTARGGDLVVQAWYPVDHPTGRLAPYARRSDVPPLFWYWGGLRTHSHANANIASHSGPYPVLLCSPTWGSRRTAHTALAEDLASHGYIVLAIDHPGNAAQAPLADGAHELPRWVGDNQFVLAQLQSGGGEWSWLGQQADLARVGAFGSSFGGAVSLAMLGAPSSLPVRAAASLDGWGLDALASRTREPILLVYAGQAPEPNSGDLKALSPSLERFGGERVTLRGAQHSAFTDQGLVSPFARSTLPDGQARALTRQLLLAFFDQSLRQQPTPFPRDPAVELQRFSPALTSPPAAR